MSTVSTFPVSSSFASCPGVNSRCLIRQPCDRHYPSSRLLSRQLSQRHQAVEPLLRTHLPGMKPAPLADRTCFLPETHPTPLSSQHAKDQQACSKWTFIMDVHWCQLHASSVLNLSVTGDSGPVFIPRNLEGLPGSYAQLGVPMVIKAGRYARRSISNS